MGYYNSLSDVHDHWHIEFSTVCNSTGRFRQLGPVNVLYSGANSYLRKKRQCQVGLNWCGSRRSVFLINSLCDKLNKDKTVVVIKTNLLRHSEICPLEDEDRERWECFATSEVEHL